MIAIVNYGLGNVRAFANVYKKLGIATSIVSSTDELSSADRIILPGVGSFDFAMQKLNDSGMRPLLEKMVLTRKVPVLGICVGMQMLALSSEEGKMKGLGWISGEVKRFSEHSENFRMCIPHMGWNSVTATNDNMLFRDLNGDSHFYFLHSYYFVCKDNSSILAETEYYGKFTSAAHSENIYGVQFHPEKSHEWGIRLLKNFAEV